MIKNSENVLKKGFTLIELLVVIAIIGVLSSITLSQLSGARSRAFDASAKSAFKALVGPAQLFYDNRQTYSGICAHQGTTANPAKFNQVWSAVQGATCNESAQGGYRVKVLLKTPNSFSPTSGNDDFLCTDASGNLRILDSDPGGVAVTCP